MAICVNLKSQWAQWVLVLICNTNMKCEMKEHFDNLVSFLISYDKFNTQFINYLQVRRSMCIYYIQLNNRWNTPMFHYNILHLQLLL